MIDLRVMNNLSDNEQAAIFENLPGGISQIDCPFHAITKAKLLRQPDRCVPHGQYTPICPDPFDNYTPVVGFYLLLHFLHHVGRAEIDLFRFCRSGSWLN